jgi:hypothetical protein
MGAIGKHKGLTALPFRKIYYRRFGGPQSGLYPVEERKMLKKSQPLD